MANYHLAILKKPYLEAILTGRKVVESRFTRTRRGAFEGVCKGDKIFLKESSGPVCGTAVVSDVKRFEGLTPERMVELEKRYNDLVCGGREYWVSKANCRFGVLVWLSEVRRIEPIRIAKKDWRAWVVLREGVDYGLLTRDFEVLKGEFSRVFGNF
jgi:ASC-1-like (ASCH) protein